jgi:predicted NBD/HSP70 family sugar kinase
MDNRLAIGIDVGASYTKVGLVGSSGQILEHCVIPSRLDSNDPSGFLSATGAVVTQYISGRTIQGIGI